MCNIEMYVSFRQPFSPACTLSHNQKKQMWVSSTGALSNTWTLVLPQKIHPDRNGQSEWQKVSKEERAFDLREGM